MNKGKQLSVNLVTQLVSFALNLAISFFLTPYVINNIGKEVYGFVSLANNFTSYIGAFTIALNGMVSRYVTIAFSKKDYKSASAYMSSVIIVNAILMIVLCPIALLFIVNLGNIINLPIGFEKDIKVLFFFVFFTFLISLPGSGFSCATYAVNRLDKSNICNMISSVIRIGLIIGLLLIFSPHVWYVGIGSFIATVYTIIMNIKYKKIFLSEVKISPKFYDIKAVKELLGVGIWNAVNQLTNLLMTGLDLMIANLFISVISMNLLSYAKMIPTQMLSLIAMVSGIFAPILTMSYAKNNMQEFVLETNFAVKLCGFLCSVPTIGLVVFGEEFFTLWLRGLSAEEIHVVAVLSILTILPQVFSVYIYPLYTVNTVTTKLRVPVLFSFVLGILNVVIVFVLVNVTTWEIYAVAGVSSILSIGRILAFTPMYAAHSIKVSLWTFYKPLIRGIISSCVMLGVFSGIRFFTNITNWMSLFAVCFIAGVIGYIISFFIVFDTEEKSKVFKKLRRVS